MTCATCGEETRRNGRGELLHANYVEHAYDHAAVEDDGPYDDDPTEDRVGQAPTTSHGGTR